MLGYFVRLWQKSLGYLLPTQIIHLLDRVGSIPKNYKLAVRFRAPSHRFSSRFQNKHAPKHLQIVFLFCSALWRHPPTTPFQASSQSACLPPKRKSRPWCGPIWLPKRDPSNWDVLTFCVLIRYIFNNRTFWCSIRINKLGGEEVKSATGCHLSEISIDISRVGVIKINRFCFFKQITEHSPGIVKMSRSKN